MNVQRKAAWRSRKKYVFGSDLGYIIFSDAHNKYFLENPRGQRKDVDQTYAMNIHNSEDANGPGRPGFFPGEKVKANSITLPERLWNKIKKPYATSLADLIDAKSENIIDTILGWDEKRQNEFVKELNKKLS
jgi:hypothetical protein